MSKSKIVEEAFCQASLELGYIQIKGRGHAHRVSFSNGAMSRAAARGTDNWEMISPYWKAGKVRFFPCQLVERAAQLTGFEIKITTERYPAKDTQENILHWYSYDVWMCPEMGISWWINAPQCVDVVLSPSLPKETEKWLKTAAVLGGKKQ